MSFVLLTNFANMCDVESVKKLLITNLIHRQGSYDAVGEGTAGLTTSGQTKKGNLTRYKLSSTFRLASNLNLTHLIFHS